MRRAAVSAFAGAMHCGVSSGVSLAVGPVGRQAEVTMQARRSYTAKIVSMASLYLVFIMHISLQALWSLQAALHAMGSFPPPRYYGSTI